jgi:hypothetical protein
MKSNVSEFTEMRRNDCYSSLLRRGTHLQVKLVVSNQMNMPLFSNASVFLSIFMIIMDVTGIQLGRNVNLCTET